MKLACISDTHGGLKWNLNSAADVVIHAGDLCPTFFPPWVKQQAAEVIAQTQWLEKNAVKINQMVGSRPFLFVHGNHEMINMGPTFRAAGIEAYDLHDEPQVIDGHSFSGFKYVPEFYGWANMLTEEPMAAALKIYEEDLLRHPCDVMVCHGPVRGVLDKNIDNQCCGNQQLYKMIQRLPKRPTHFVCGHIHDSNGRTRHMEIEFINCATSAHLVELR